MRCFLTPYSHAGYWLFSSRRWLNPLEPQDRAQLEDNFEALGNTFQPFAAHCEIGQFIFTLRNISAAWSQLLSHHDSGNTDPDGTHDDIKQRPSSCEPVATAAPSGSACAYPTQRHDVARSDPTWRGPGPKRRKTAVAALRGGRRDAANFTLQPIPPGGHGPLGHLAGPGWHGAHPAAVVRATEASGRDAAGGAGPGAADPHLPPHRLDLPALLPALAAWLLQVALGATVLRRLP